MSSAAEHNVNPAFQLNLKQCAVILHSQSIALTSRLTKNHVRDINTVLKFMKSFDPEKVNDFAQIVELDYSASDDSLSSEHGEALRLVLSHLDNCLTTLGSLPAPTPRKTHKKTKLIHEIQEIRDDFQKEFNKTKQMVGTYMVGGFAKPHTTSPQSTTVPFPSTKRPPVTTTPPGFHFAPPHNRPSKQSAFTTFLPGATAARYPRISQPPQQRRQTVVRPRPHRPQANYRYRRNPQWRARDDSSCMDWSVTTAKMADCSVLGDKKKSSTNIWYKKKY